MTDPAEEILDVVDENDEVIGQAPRGEVYARGLIHRCAFVLVRDAQDRIFVHRRTPTKLLFPSLYDMFVGGVLGAGESYDAAALREAEEELGVSGLPRPAPLFRFLHDSGGVAGKWWSAVYEVRCELPVNPQATEVAWHAFMPEEELTARLGTWEWVPDGLAAYERMSALRAGRPAGRQRASGSGAGGSRASGGRAGGSRASGGRAGGSRASGGRAGGKGAAELGTGDEGADG